MSEAHKMCSVDDCGKPNKSRGYCDAHYRRWKATGSTARRSCPTCARPIDCGPGKHAYCSDECRPSCAFDGCHKPRRGSGDLCSAHCEQMRLRGELKPSRWAEERVCVVCGKEVPAGTGMRKHCSGRCHRLGVHRPERPKSYNCARCSAEVSLICPTGKYGKFKRSDARLCPSCKKRPPWAALSVRQLADRDGTDCGVCNYRVDLNETGNLGPSIDHVIPRAAGGSDDADNLQLTHLWCNMTKNWRKNKAAPLGPARLRYIADGVKSHV